MAELAIEYAPRDEFLPFHERQERWSCMVAHRRAGKTYAVIYDLVTRALYTQKKNARYAYVAPFYRQAKDVAWQYLKEATTGFSVKIRESELRIELFNGAWITLYGADNPDALRGLYLDGVVLDEFGDCRPALWGEVILPALADRKGWAVFIGTPKGKNHFYDMFERSIKDPAWFNLLLPVSVTNIFDPEELEQICQQMAPEEYAQEFECSFDAAIKGTYYADMINMMDPERFGHHPHQNDKKVSVASDLGYDDSTALWFWQMQEHGPTLIDYEESSQQSMQFYMDLLESKGYEYDTIWLPHDSKAKTFQTGRSTMEQFMNRDFPVRVVPKLSVQDGIAAVRHVLPKCYFNLPATHDGLNSLRNYKKNFNSITKSFSKTPKHDWASNGADSFRYFSLVTKEELEPTVEPGAAKPIYTPPKITLDELWQDHGKVINLVRHRI